MIEILPCIVCGAKFEPASKFVEGNQPYAGTTFSSHGQYGSTVFDPMNIGGHLTLEINVCDTCLLSKAAAKEVYFIERIDKTPDWAIKYWEPDKDYQ